MYWMLIFIIFNCCYATTELEELQITYKFSTAFNSEVEANQLLEEKVEEVVNQNLTSMTDTLLCVRLLYIQGNHLLYADRPVKAQKKLLLAKELIEKYDLSADSRLTPFYAMVLHLLGKAYLYPWDRIHELHYEEGEKYLQESIRLRESIDLHPDQFDDSYDNNKEVGNTLIFKRVLAHIYYKKGLYAQAEEMFAEIRQNPDHYNQLMCLKDLLPLYRETGQWEKADESAKQMEALLLEFPNIHRISIFYTLLGKVQVDETDQISLKILAKQLFYNMYCEEFLIDLAIYQLQELKDLRCSYDEQSALDAISLFEDPIAYGQLGKVYSCRGDKVRAYGLYSNGLSIAELDELIECYPPHFYDQIKKYRQQLKTLRDEVNKNLHLSADSLFQLIFDGYKSLILEIMNDVGEVPSCALIAGGSLGNHTVTPYSDVELAILVSNETVMDQWTQDLVLRVTAIGESPIRYFKIPGLDKSPSPRGFMIDPGLLLKSFLVKTPQEMSEIKSNAFIYYSYLAGDKNLIEQYESSLTHKEHKFQDLMNKDLTRWALKDYIDEKGRRCFIKYDFYRPFDVILKNYALKEGIRKPLQVLEKLDSPLKENLKDVYEKWSKMRIAHYLECGQQEDLIDCSLEELDHLHSVLNEFHALFEVTFEGFHDLQKDIEYYGEIHPFVADDYFLLGDYQKAYEIDRVMFGTHHPRMKRY